jgi:hypothetical protein
VGDYRSLAKFSRAKALTTNLNFIKSFYLLIIKYMLMTQEIIPPHQIPNCLILTEEWEVILKAMSAGKYSWACVLMLYTVGHNPLAYIPYSTYLRLVKSNNIPNIIKTRKNNSIGVKFVAIKTKFIDLDC